MGYVSFREGIWELFHKPIKPNNKGSRINHLETEYHCSFFFPTLLVILVVPVISTMAIPKELGRDCRVGRPQHFAW